MSKPQEYSYMTKDKLMTYTFVALLVLAIVSAALWSQITPFDPVTGTYLMNLGLTVAIVCLVSVGVAVGIDALLYKLAADSPLNTMSAAVFGLIVALSYSLGVPGMATSEASLLPLSAPAAFFYVALISGVGMVVFKKVVGLSGRKYVNPAAAAKLVVLLPFLSVILIPSDHTIDIPTLATNLGNADPTSFGAWLQFCFGNPAPLLSGVIPTYTQMDIFRTLFLDKYHGWIGGASSLAVIIVGLALFALARRYIKWRITLAYIITTVAFSAILGTVYGGDILIRIMFHLFVGSSIFLAFFMATDPATTPLTYAGQAIFGVGVAVITILLQTFAGFFGGSIVALIIMNLVAPKLDGFGRLKPVEGGEETKLPKAKMFTEVKTTPCIRCGACMRVCCNRLSPILIKQARDKQQIMQLMKLDADFCAGCGHCNYVCPARIDLKSSILNVPISAAAEGVAIEQTFLKGTTDENLGVYTDMFSAKSSYEGQDGGVVTALLVSGLQKGIFDAAIVVKRTKGYLAQAFVAENADDIIKAKGTKYIRVRLMSKLGELIAKGKRKIAVVGTPCEVRAARRAQQALLSECPDLELTVIGLFCFEDFNYRTLKSEVQRLLKVDLDTAEKTQIKKGKFIVTIGGKESSVPVKELSAAVEKGCSICPDFTSQYADVSVGSVGSEDGRSTVIVRSEVGEKLVQGLDLARADVNKDEVVKLSVLKKTRAEKNA